MIQNSYEWQVQKNVRTADMYVKILGQIDVYTPKTNNIDNILRNIADKAKQGNGVLVQKDLSFSQMQNLANRLWGKPEAKNMNVLLFQDSTGKIFIFNKPKLLLKIQVRNR